jgi:hypothetical protein
MDSFSLSTNLAYKQMFKPEDVRGSWSGLTVGSSRMSLFFLCTKLLLSKTHRLIVSLKVILWHVAFFTGYRGRESEATAARSLLVVALFETGFH